jgi:hypothetical protein
MTALTINAFRETFGISELQNNEMD